MKIKTNQRMTVVCALIAFTFLTASCASAPAPANEGGGRALGTAIAEAARQIEGALAEKTAVAILNIQTNSESLANFIIEELSGALVNGKKLVITDRKNLDLIRQEMNWQLSGEVSDDSLQEIGKKLGAEFIISGSFTDLGGTYRLRVQAVNVSSAVLESQYSETVAADNEIAYLIARDKAAEDAKAAASPIPAAREPTVKQGAAYKIGDWGPAGGIVFYDKGNDEDGWRYLEAAPKELEKQLSWFPEFYFYDEADMSDFEDAEKESAPGTEEDDAQEEYKKQLLSQFDDVEFEEEADRSDTGDDKEAGSFFGIKEEGRSYGTKAEIGVFGAAIGTGKANTEKAEAFLNTVKRNHVDAADIPVYAASYCASIDYDDFSDWYLPSIDELELMEKNLWENGLGEFNYMDVYWSSSSTGEFDDDELVVWVYDFYGDYAKKRGVPASPAFTVRPVRAFK